MKITPIQQMKYDMYKLEKQAHRCGKCAKIAATVLGISAGAFATDALTADNLKELYPRGIIYALTINASALTSIVAGCYKKQKIQDYNDVANAYLNEIKHDTTKTTIANV